MRTTMMSRNTGFTVFDDDELGILKSPAETIFDIKHVPKTTTMPEYIAHRKPCEDFETFAPLLQQCQSDIKDGKRRLWPFSKAQQIEEGHFFVLKGVLLY